MIQIQPNFDGAVFAQKYNLDVDDFRVDGGILICPSLPNLIQQDIADCVIDEWAIIRRQRDARLSACDWTQLPDAVLTIEEKSAWSDYRQALRDIPQDFTAPEDVIFPTPPNEVSNE